MGAHALRGTALPPDRVVARGVPRHCDHARRALREPARRCRARRARSAHLQHGRLTRGASLGAQSGGKAMKWITREHPRVDRVACPWLIEKFVDKSAEFVYVPTDKVMAE